MLKIIEALCYAVVVRQKGLCNIDNILFKMYVYINLKKPNFY